MTHSARSKFFVPTRWLVAPETRRGVAGNQLNCHSVLCQRKLFAHIRQTSSASRWKSLVVWEREVDCRGPPNERGSNVLSENEMTYRFDNGPYGTNAESFNHRTPRSLKNRSYHALTFSRPRALHRV